MNEFPKVGFGTWELTGKEVKPSIQAAIKTGYKHIDTAQVYNNETQIGVALKDIKIKRDDIFITSKIWPLNYKYHAYKSIKESIKRLGLKKIDLMLLHSPLPEERYDDVIIAYKEMMKAREEGLLTHIGVSNFPVKLLKVIKKRTGEYPFANQIVFSPTVILEDVEKFCKKKNIELVGYSTLRAYFNPNPWYEGSGFSNQQKSRVDELVVKYKKDAGQILSKWALQNGYHIIPKSSKPKRVKSNFDLNDFELSIEEVKELRKWNTYTTKKMLDTFSTQLDAKGEYEKLQKKGMLFTKNY